MRGRCVVVVCARLRASCQAAGLMTDAPTPEVLRTSAATLLANAGRVRQKYPGRAAAALKRAAEVLAVLDVGADLTDPDESAGDH